MDKDQKKEGQQQPVITAPETPTKAAMCRSTIVYPPHAPDVPIVLADPRPECAGLEIAMAVILAAIAKK